MLNFNQQCKEIKPILARWLREGKGRGHIVVQKTPTSREGWSRGRDQASEVDYAGSSAGGQLRLCVASRAGLVDAPPAASGGAGSRLQAAAGLGARALIEWGVVGEPMSAGAVGGRRVVPIACRGMQARQQHEHQFCPRQQRHKFHAMQTGHPADPPVWCGTSRQAGRQAGGRAGGRSGRRAPHLAAYGLPVEQLGESARHSEVTAQVLAVASGVAASPGRPAEPAGLGSGSTAVDTTSTWAGAAAPWVCCCCRRGGGSGATARCCASPHSKLRCPTEQEGRSALRMSSSACAA
jgi:hypothetical protein